MKPCIECGLAIHNNSTICEECGRPQKTNSPTLESSKSEDAEGIPQESVSTVLILAEIAVRTLIVAMLPVCVLIGVLYFVIPLMHAVIMGAVVGLLVGFAYSIVEMYFQNN